MALLCGGAALLPAPASAASVPQSVSQPVPPAGLPVAPSAPLQLPPAAGPGPVPGRDNPTPKGVFDPATSRPVEALTTPSRVVFANADGSRTAQVSTRPVRFKDPAGSWRDLDLTLTPDGQGRLHGKAAPPSATTIGGRSRGALLMTATTAGPLQVAVDGVGDVTGVPTGSAVRYSKALGGADLKVELTVDGFEESLVLPDATGPAAHVLRFTLPAGVAARQSLAGVEFTDPTGAPVAIMGNGLAADSATTYGGGGQESPVNSGLVSQAGRTVLVSVQVDPLWLADPARVFPVTVDPTLITTTGSPGAGNYDTWVMTSYTSSQFNSPELRIGTPDGGASVARSYLHWDLSGLPVPLAAVSEAHLRIFNTYSWSCSPYSVGVFAASGPFGSGTVWGNQPGPTTPGALGSSSYAHGYSSGCPGTWDTTDLTGLAQQWGNGASPNFGVMLATNEANNLGWKKFYSGNSGANSAPQLYITYNTLPTRPTIPIPAAGAVVSSLTPTLSVGAATDGDGDTVQYYFRVSRSKDGEGGAGNVVAESGMQTSTAYQVPVNALRDGTTYFWHVYTWDGKNYGLKTDPQPFRTDLRLGSHGPSPYDSAGPVTVNLANGNLVFAPALPAVPVVGGSLAVGLVYNSQAAPGAASNGLSRGWTLSAGDAPYTEARQSADGSVTLSDATGAQSRFTQIGSNPALLSYQPPADMDQAVLSGVSGRWTLHDQDGSTYIFGASGLLETAVSGVDDRKPAAPVMTWSALAGVSGARLASVRDPVSGAQLTLHYGTDPANSSPVDGTCAAQALPVGTARAPVGALCQVDYPDASTAQLRYNADGLLVRLQNPGPAVYDLRYDSLARLAAVREPLADEWVRAADTASRDTDATRTLIDYSTDPAVNPGKVARVRLADPTPLAAVPDDRPSRSYGYPSTTSSSVLTAGLPAPRTVTFDGALRTLTDTDPTGVSTTGSWHDDDRPVAAVDAASRISTTAYDDRKRPTDSYGPATATGTGGAACFDAAYNGTGAPTGAAGCTPTAAVAHTHTDYDQAMTGLAATWWPNNTWNGPPTLHSTVNVDSTGAMDWGYGGPAGLGAVDNFSGRFTGTLTAPTDGDYTLAIDADDAARLYLDDYLVIDRGTGPNGHGEGQAPDHWAAGSKHRIRLDYAEYTLLANLRLTWKPSAGAAFSPVGSAAFTPNYALATSSTIVDQAPGSQTPSRTTTSSYAAPENGLVTASVVDPVTAANPGGLNLTSATSYEGAGAGYLRRTAKTMPSGAQSTYSYYGDTQTAANPCAPTAPATSQGGRARSSTNPVDSAGNAWSQSSVYDQLGRPVASWWNSEATPTCTGYDARGRTVSVVTAQGSATPRTVTTSYAVGGDPLVSAVTDSASTGSTTITTSTDLLGRVVLSVDVYDTATTSTYDQAGRVTATATTTYAQTPSGAGVTRGAATGTRSEAFTYDAAGRLLTQAENGTVLATVSYHPASGELTGVAYANNTGLAAISRDSAGRQLSQTWTFAPTGQSTTDTVIRSYDGRIQRASLTASNQPVRFGDYTYDGAGRRATATVHGGGTLAHDLRYEFGAGGPGSCPTGAVSAAAAGRNTNRTLMTDSWTDPTLPAGSTPVTTTTGSCYDATDRLLATSSSSTSAGSPPPATSASYDSHGNTLTLGGQRLTFDADDRNTGLSDATSTTVSYPRDATDRIVWRNATGTGSAVTPGQQQYSYTGPGDTPDLTLDATTHTITERTTGAARRRHPHPTTHQPGRHQPALGLPQPERRHHRHHRPQRRHQQHQLPLRPVRPAPGPHHPGSWHRHRQRRRPRHHHRPVRQQLARPTPTRPRTRRHPRPHPDGRPHLQPSPRPVPPNRPGRGWIEQCV